MVRPVICISSVFSPKLMGTFLRVHLNRVMRLQFRKKAAARTRQVGVMVFVLFPLFHAETY